MNGMDAIYPGEIDLSGHDVAERIDYLTSLLESGDDFDDRDEYAEELRDLESLAEQLETVGNPRDLNMVHESSWERYAQDMFHEYYGDSVPSAYIDYEMWAKDLAMDYSAIEWGGDTYYVS